MLSVQGMNMNVHDHCPRLAWPARAFGSKCVRPPPLRLRSWREGGGGGGLPLYGACGFHFVRYAKRGMT